MRRLFATFFALTLLWAPSSNAQFTGCLPGFCGAAPVATCTEGDTFLARTSGLDVLHTNAYSNLICGLVADGIWTKFDFLHIYATQDSTTALLNLVSTSFNSVLHGAPTFTADRGFQGVDGSTTVYISTGFNPTVGTPQYTQDSAHISGWNLTNSTFNAGMTGSAAGGGGTNHNYVLPKFTDNNTYWRLNVDCCLGQALAIGDPRGHFLISRIDNNNDPGYINGLGIFAGGPASTSVAPANFEFYSLGINSFGTAAGFGGLLAMDSVGSKFANGTEVLKFYNRLRTYMTTVGVP